MTPQLFASQGLERETRLAESSDIGAHSVHSGSGCCLSSCAQNADHVATKPSGDEPGPRGSESRRVRPCRTISSASSTTSAAGASSSPAWSPFVSKSPPISPLAPASFPRSARGRRGSSSPPTRRALSYRGRFDVMLAALAPGSRVAGVFTRSRCASAPVNWCRGAHRARYGAGGPMQRRQRQCVHRRRGRGNGGRVGAGRGAEPWMRLRKMSTSPRPGSSANRSARRPCRRQWSRRPGRSDPPTPGSLAGRRGRHPHHRHVPEGGRGERRNSMARRCGVAAGRQGERDDRARHVDDALLRVHGRGPSRLRVAIPPRRGGGPQLQPDHGRFPTPRRATVSSSLRPGRSRPLRRSPAPPIRGSTTCGRSLDATMLDLAHQIVRDGRGGEQVRGSDRRGGPRERCGCATDRPEYRELAPRQDHARGGGRELGPAGNGRRQGRRSGGTRPGCASGSATSSAPRAAGSARGTPKSGRPSTLRGDEVRLRADIGVGNGRNTIWTCDLTHAYIDINAGYRS